MKQQLYSGIISSVIEISIVHPIDVYKTLYQQDRNYNIKKFLKLNNKYRGFQSRLFGIVPMRTVFWTSQDYAETQFTKYSIIKIHGTFDLKSEIN